MAKDNNKMVQISRREQRLRERVLALDEDLIRDERHARDKRDNRFAKLNRKIEKIRRKQTAKLDRLEASKLYNKCKPLYWLLSPLFAIGRWFKRRYQWITKKVDHHKATTPHRTFYLTKHADAVREIKISGYLRFVHEVWRMIWDYRWLYLKVLAIVSIAFMAVIGLGVQSDYTATRDALMDTELHPFFAWVGAMTQAIITSVTVSDVNKQMIAAAILLITWLTLIYISRDVYNGRARQLKVRDALYRAGGPIVPTLLILALVMLQLLPLAIAMMAYSSLSGASYINQGIQIENMAAWMIIFLIGVLTIYWMVTSLLTLITVTIPGMYPLEGYFQTSVKVSGRRVKILLRLLVMLLPLILVWLVVLGAVVVLDMVVKFQNFPLVQITTTVLVAASVIWIATYLFALYRHILDSPDMPEGTYETRFIWPWQRKRRQVRLNNRKE